jgi:RNA-directed DNA polymerase
VTATQVVAAPSHETMDWRSLNWTKIQRQVQRLQMRIAKAAREGNLREVKAFQRLLTRSFAAKALAVKRVTENKGKKTPGVDGVIWSTPEAKFKAVLSLNRRGYKPLPLRRTYVPKSNGKKRPLGIPIKKDLAMQALYKLALEPVAETMADKNSYGFRPLRSTADAIQQCWTALVKKTSPSWVLEGDIKGCFDNISHDWLMTNIPMDKDILRKWLKAGYIDLGTLYPTPAGTPQGAIISPVLANMTLDGLEAELKKAFRQKDKVHMVRYADDFIITGASKAILEDKVCPLVESFLRDRGLELSLEKTRITHIDEGFDFLGQNIRKYGGKLLIKPAKKNVKAFLDKARKTVKGNLAAKQVNLIGLLNPIIRGWANYHRHVAAKETFSKADHRIWQALWQWCRRRHPKKGTRWIKAKYFKKRGTRNWVFAAETERIRPDGKPVMLELARADNTRIWRHIKIRAKANPFDPSWDSYFKERLRLLKGGISRDTDGGHSDFYPSAVISSLLQNASKPLWNAK